MRILTAAKSVASSFLLFLQKDEHDLFSAVKNTSSRSVSSRTRGEAKRTLTIRKREFDKLRALRQNEILDDDKPKQRFLHTSKSTDLSEKTSTIKKIDEIEAQMSMQWWKTERLDLNLQEDSKKPH